MTKISEYAFGGFGVYAAFWTTAFFFRNVDPKIDRMLYRLQELWAYFTLLLLLHTRNLSFFCITSLPRKKSNGGKSRRQEHRLDNNIFYCYVLPITTNSISSVHFNLRKYIVKQIEQRVTCVHDNPILQCMDSTGVLIQYMENPMQ